jgi:parallel beta-helix repeat protein
MRFSTSLVLMSLFVSLAALPSVAATLNVPSQYSTIQAAINAAHPGDTVKVSPKSGSDPAYHETVVIQTPLTLKGVHGATIDGNGTVLLLDPFNTGTPFPYQHDAIVIQANNVTVTGLTIKNFIYQVDPFDLSPTSNGYVCAIRLDAFSNCNIQNDTLTNDWNGIGINGAAQPSVATNTIQNSSVAVLAFGPTQLTLTSNTITNNLNFTDGYGVVWQGTAGSVDAGGCVIQSNEISFNDSGLTILNSQFSAGNTTLTSNDIHDNVFTGVTVEFGGTPVVSLNLIYNNGIGIITDGAINTQITQNVIYDNVGEPGSGGLAPNAGDGIYISGGFDFGGFPADNNTISQNVVFGNHGDGIHIFGENFFGIVIGDEGNTITQNVAVGNTLFDAEDDTFDGTQVYNTWTHNVFGTTSPTGLD